MTTDREPRRVEASRRMEVPAARIFDVLADPRRHADFDGSGMLRGSVEDRPVTGVGDTFTMRMQRAGDDYLMLNHVVEFERDRRIAWAPSPGDLSRAEDHDPAKVGVPVGYRWRYLLEPDGDDATVVTEVFDLGPLSADLLADGGAWINTTTPVVRSMEASLRLLEEAAAT